MHPLLNIESLVCFHKASQPIIQGLSLNLAPGEHVSLVGSSGCGKTTLLRAIAGLHRVHTGSIRLSGQALSQGKVHLPAEKRHIGMVFQEPSLFPHLSVMDNLSFALKGENTGFEKRDSLIETLGLGALCNQYPHQLSGGQKQRVALARAMVTEPQLMLLDEPFSSLDPASRAEMAVDINEILSNQNIASILVTHDQDEAFAYGDRVGVLHEGKIIQIDTAENLYYQPACPHVANFIGHGTWIEGKVENDGSVKTSFGRLENATKGMQPTNVKLFIRPEQIKIHPEGLYKAQLISKQFISGEFECCLQVAGGEKLLARIASEKMLPEGSELSFDVSLKKLIVF